MIMDMLPRVSITILLNDSNSPPPYLQVHQNNGIWSIIIFAFLGAAFEKLDAMGLLEWLKRRSRRANRWNASASAKEVAETEAEAEAPPSSNPTSKSTNKSTNKKKKIH